MADAPKASGWHIHPPAGILSCINVYDRFELFPGAKLGGPAIIEEKESTIIVGEDANAEVDEFGFIWIEYE